MGWLFNKNVPVVQPENLPNEDSQEEYEQYMMGFRLGFPVEDDPPPIIPDEDNVAFQRGLADGQREFQQAQERRRLA